MAEATGYTTQFPSQSVDDATKASEKYGLEVARGIKNEWFRNSSRCSSDLVFNKIVKNL